VERVIEKEAVINVGSVKTQMWAPPSAEWKGIGCGQRIKENPGEN